MEIKEQTVTKTVRYIEFDGKRFYEDGKGYWLGQEKGPDGVPRRIRLHTYVWEKYNGPIPDGYVIHHIDRDKTNNNIENLAMLEAGEHRKLHSALLDDAARERFRENLQTNARPAASEWHRSDEGRTWHKEHFENVTRPLMEEKIEKTCSFCGKPFLTPKFCAGRTQYCSNNCKVRARYHSGVDNEVRICTICGKAFTTNKYSRIKTCGKACANISESRVKSGKPRPPRKAP